MIARWRAGDAEAVLARMTDDVMFPTREQPAFGKTGDLAYARSNVTSDVTFPEGETVHLAGPVLSVFRKGEDGQWRTT